MTPSVEIRRATPGDTAAIAAIEAVSFPHPWTEAQFAGELSNPFAWLFVAVCGGAPCGYAEFDFVAGQAHLNTFAVAPDRRGQGIGRALLAGALDRLAGEGAFEITLEVRPGNTAARALYAQLGFTAVGLRRGFYRDPPEDGLTMKLTLTEKR